MDTGISIHDYGYVYGYTYGSVCAWLLLFVYSLLVVYMRTYMIGLN